MAHQPGVIRIQSNPRTPTDSTGRGVRVWVNGLELTHMARNVKVDMGVDHGNYVTLELVGVVETIDAEAPVIGLPGGGGE